MNIYWVGEDDIRSNSRALNILFVVVVVTILPYDPGFAY